MMRALNDPRVVFDSLDRLQHVEGGLSEMYSLRVSLILAALERQLKKSDKALVANTGWRIVGEMVLRQSR